MHLYSECGSRSPAAAGALSALEADIADAGLEVAEIDLDSADVESQVRAALADRRL